MLLLAVSRWRDLSERFGRGSLPTSGFAAGLATGPGAMLKKQVLALAEADGGIDWDAPIDSTIVRAYQHGAGAGQGGLTGSSRGHGKASDAAVAG